MTVSITESVPKKQTESNTVYKPMDVLVVIDMQNDFIDGSLGTIEAQSIVGKVADKIKSFNGKVIFTRDTHNERYLNTQEGTKLPVSHCVKGTDGWQLHPTLVPFATTVIDKPTFGSVQLAQLLSDMDDISGITLIGLCTDICVISNALMLKGFMPEIPITVDASCCAGVTPQSHKNALDAMKCCQINIICE